MACQVPALGWGLKLFSWPLGMPSHQPLGLESSQTDVAQMGGAGACHSYE